MEFMIEKGPHIKDQDTTSKIMKRLLIALIPIIIFSIYKNGIMLYQTGSATFYQALRPLIMILLSVFTSVL
ncbi:MAG: RnfABCDGE type electron transport complex subunit D, partial [Bacilli bacterium]|nr:RnfABCDGE type electron transport complex subunit D [Bacilli bacterium]